MSLESRFDPPTQQEELKPATTCAHCHSELYYGDEVYQFNDRYVDEFYCDQCGLDAIIERYEPDHKVTLDKEHI